MVIYYIFYYMFRPLLAIDKYIETQKVLESRKYKLQNRKHTTNQHIIQEYKTARNFIYYL